MRFELGVGYHTPGIIKYPFEQFTAANARATLVRINRDAPEIHEANKDKTLAFCEDTGEILVYLAGEEKRRNMPEQ